MNRHDPAQTKMVNPTEFGRSRRSKAMLYLLVLCAGIVGVLLLSSCVGIWVARQNVEMSKLRFGVVAKRFSEQLERRLLIFEYGLRGARGAIIAGGGEAATYGQFRQYIETRDVGREFPGAGGFGFIRPVKPENMESFIARVRREGQASFEITQVVPQAGERYVVEYMQSRFVDRVVVGLDIASEPNRRAAADAAVDTGAATITAPITLRKANGDPDEGFLILLPVFRSGDSIDTPQERRQALIGWVYTVIDISDILTKFDTIVGDFGFSISDGGIAPFYASGPAPDEASGIPVQDAMIELYGRTWDVKLWALPLFLDSLHLVNPLSAFAVTLVFSLLLTSLIVLQIVYRARRRAQDIERSRLAAIVEGANDAIVGKSFDGTIISWNDGAERLFGYSASEAIGRTANELIVPPFLHEEELRLIADVRAGARVANFRSQRIKRNGDLAHVAISVSRIWADDAVLIGFATVARDITDVVNAESQTRDLNASLEKQVADRTEQLLKASTLQTAILKRASYAIIAADMPGTITLFNPAAERMLGYKAEELIGRKTVEIFYDPQEIAVRAEELRRQGISYGPGLGVVRAGLSLGDPHTAIWTFITKTGDRIPVRLTLSSLRSDTYGNLGVLGIAVDMTEQLKYENALKAARMSAEQASAAKAEFLANMSHEIRTPLNGIIGYADLVLEDQTLAPDTRRQVACIFEASDSLRVIIDDILDFSKIEACGVQLESKPLYIKELIDNCASIIRPRAEEKGLKLVVAARDVPLVLLGDAARLRQVLLNLMNNAVKFSATGSVELIVSGISSMNNSARLRIAVIDTGIGISKEKQGSLFKRFSQADETISRKFGGTGLGLVISQRIVQAMQSELKIDSEPGRGSTFYFEIELPIIDQIDVEREESPVQQSRSLKILVVDDVEMNRDLCRNMLSRAGHKVDLADSGGTAIKMLAGHDDDYDLIFMDVQMGEMDGMEATRRIRAMSGIVSAVPIVALTANVLPEQVERYKAAGMDDHIGKPINRAKLLACAAKLARDDPRHRAASSLATDQPAARAPAVLEQEVLEELRLFASEDDIVGFADQLRNAIDSLPALPPQSDATQIPDEEARDALRRAAHKAVALAGQLGFTQLAEACRRLENACLRAADVPEAFDALHVAIDSAAPEIENLRAVA